MLKVKLAKSLMENEEGMNHIWIRIPPLNSLNTSVARLCIHLPEGIYRTRNLNGYFEDNFRSILIQNHSQEQNILIEIYIKNQIPSKKATIAIELIFRDHQKNEKKIAQTVTFTIVNEDEMEGLVINEDVVSLLKELKEYGDEIETEFIYIQPKTQNVDNEFSHLEEKYRIEF